MDKLITILIGITGALSISFYLNHNFFECFGFEQIYFMIGGIILAVLIHRSK